MLIAGGVILAPTDRVAVFIQPFAGSVTVSEYVPMIDAATENVVAPVGDQEYVPPAVVVVPVTTTVVLVQVMVGLLVMLTFGWTVLEVIERVAELLQPFEGSVTFRV